MIAGYIVGFVRYLRITTERERANTTINQDNQAICRLIESNSLGIME